MPPGADVTVGTVTVLVTVVVVNPGLDFVMVVNTVEKVVETRVLVTVGVVRSVTVTVDVTGEEVSVIVVVDASHVVLEVPLAGESVSGKRPVASFVGAQIRLVSMAVHGVSLTLVSEKACSRREAGVLARVHLASVGLQVGVDKFATSGDWSDPMHISNIYRGREDLTHSCTSASRACGCNRTGPPMGSGKVHRLGEMHSGKEGGPGQKIHHRRWCDAQRKGARQMHPH